MRVFSITATAISESDALPAQAPDQGFIWIGCTRQELEGRLTEIQSCLQALCGIQLLDLHVSDLVNTQLPSHFDYTSQYDLLVFRRLASQSQNGEATTMQPAHHRGGPPILRHIDTSPVGFAIFENVLLSVHPSDCAVRDAYASRLKSSAHDLRTANSRLPTSPADLTLRIVNLMVDGFLELRRELTRQLDHWQAELLNPRTRFSNWTSLLDARLSLRQLDELCEDQRQAVIDWIEVIEDWPEAGTPMAQRERDQLQVRSRDLLEHIERVVHHVRRLEHSIETVVQMHFSAQSNRTNDIMRTLTVLTAIFLPLNLIAGIFGMNFDAIPLIHSDGGFWWAMGSMGLTAVALALLFWRKRYLERSGR
ncbi:magnesium transporter CorA family protein [Rhodoferax sp. BAB1]|uniref:magnesium transporter CorA family protein n=1 Tax=Rhodoferax sp. BAB1 TaxID=2741720 RepID=UPI0015759EB4|nr:magnesium transporter CorA family protein [Rhodoferax sp. BAB1]QKO23217.1 magnesium transporter CorA family protein [Rhodoferax sp. BAB1]